MGVAVAGGWAYIADGRSGLQVVDVSDPMDPLVIGTLDSGRDAARLHSLLSVKLETIALPAPVVALVEADRDLEMRRGPPPDL